MRLNLNLFKRRPPDVRKLAREENTKALIKALKYRKNPEIRAHAARNLEWIPDPQALEPLIKALKDEDLMVRIYATAAITRMPYPIEERIVKALKDPNPDIRIGAARILNFRAGNQSWIRCKD